MGNSVSHCTPVNRRTDPGKELLRCAEAGDTQLLSLILNGDARYLLHSSVFGGNTAWHKAAKAGKLEVLEAMEQLITKQFEGQQDVCCKDISDLRLVILRLGSNPLDITRRLINRANLKGVTPLMLACMGGHTNVVAWLLKHGADVWRHDRVRRQTALHYAAGSGASDAIRLVLAQAGAAVHPSNAKTLLEQGNHAGLTALHYAVYCDQCEVLQQLLAHEADITVQAEYPDLDWGSVSAGDTPMHIAASKGSIDIIQAMLRAYNERSGALLPADPFVPRRMRDPRAMRNDYGRLPYHLAMRRGFTWLGEMLDPSVPVRYLLAGEELDTTTQWGPPRLAVIAAAALHKSLLADLHAIKAEVAAEAAAAAAVACSHVTSQFPSSVTQQEAGSTWLLGVGQQAQATAATAGEDGVGVVSRSNSRRWMFPTHRRTGSAGPSSRPPSHRRSNSGGALHSLAEGVGRLSRGGTGSARASSRRSSARGEGGPATPGPLSPRLSLRSVMRIQSGSPGADPDCLECTVLHDECCDPASTLEGGEPGSCPASPADAASTASSSWVQGMAEVVVNGALLSPHRRVKHVTATATWLYSGSTSSNGGGGSGGIRTQQHQGPAEQQDNDPLQRQHQSCLSPSQSISYCSAGPEVSGCWQEDTDEYTDVEDCSSSCCPAGGGDGEAIQHAASGVPSLDDGLWDQVEFKVNSAAPALCHDGSSTTDGATCGVCLDAQPTARILPCDHSMCADCALDMCQRFSMSTAVCPFCRAIIRSFAPVRPAQAGTQMEPQEHLKPAIRAALAPAVA